jgi:amidase
VDSPIATTVDEDVKSSVLAAARSCEELGHKVESLSCPFTAQVVDDFLLYWGFAAWLQKVTARIMLHRGFDSAKLEPWSLRMAQTFLEQPRGCAEAILRLRGFQATYAEWFRRFDVLMCPTVASAALPIGHLATDFPYETVRARLRTFTPFTPIQNASGAPAISLPLGRSASGLPIGVQFAAACGEDALLLSLALSLEEHSPWPRSAPPPAPPGPTQ